MQCVLETDEIEVREHGAGVGQPVENDCFRLSASLRRGVVQREVRDFQIVYAMRKKHAAAVYTAAAPVDALGLATGANGLPPELLLKRLLLA